MKRFFAVCLCFLIVIGTTACTRKNNTNDLTPHPATSDTVIHQTNTIDTTTTYVPESTISASSDPITTTTESTTQTTLVTTKNSTTQATTTTQKTTTTKKPTTTTTRKSTTTQKTTTTTKAKSVLIDFVGKTVGDVQKVYGKNYSLHGYNGGIMLNYGDFAFVIADYYEEPKDYREEDREILYAISYSNKGLVGDLKGTMTYPEIVAAVGKNVKLDKPKYWGNEEFESMWEYTLEFEYQGYTVMYEWGKDPNKYASAQATIVKQEKTVTTTKKTTATTKAPAVTTTERLMQEIEAFVETNYFEEDRIVKMEIAYEDETSLSLYVITCTQYLTDYGIEYNKTTRTIELYYLMGAPENGPVFTETLP